MITKKSQYTANYAPIEFWFKHESHVQYKRQSLCNGGMIKVWAHYTLIAAQMKFRFFTYQLLYLVQISISNQRPND